jgi:polyisoprenoid-binding protein YceI
MSDLHSHDHEHEPGHQHDHGHEHDHDDEHDHALIIDRLPEGTWRVDPAGSEVLFKARALFGLLPVSGIFDRFAGELRVDQAGAATGSLVVETASIGTGVGRRDADLRGPGYFNVEKYPSMTFTLEAIEASGQDHLNATGTLEIRGTRIPLKFEVYAIAHGDHLHLEGGALIDHDAAGLRWAKPGMVSKRARAEAALTLTRA